MSNPIKKVKRDGKRRMEKRISNKDLNKANKNKKDEFYTQLSDIEKDPLMHQRS